MTKRCFPNDEIGTSLYFITKSCSFCSFNKQIRAYYFYFGVINDFKEIFNAHFWGLFFCVFYEKFLKRGLGLFFVFFLEKFLKR